MKNLINNKSYEMIDNAIVFDNGNDLLEANLDEVIENLVSITGMQIEEQGGYLCEFAEYAYDDYFDGHGLSAMKWFRCDVKDVEQAVMMSNPKVLQP